VFSNSTAVTLRIAGVSITAPNLFGLMALACFGLLSFGMYLQHVVGLTPCPMCIVQRYAMIGVLVLGAVGWRLRKALPLALLGVLLVLMAGFGAFVAARQSWLQWYPPEVVSCGRDLYGMIETFPLKRALPMIFGAAAIAARACCCSVLSMVTFASPRDSALPPGCILAIFFSALSIAVVFAVRRLFGNPGKATSPIGRW